MSRVFCRLTFALCLVLLFLAQVPVECRDGPFDRGVPGDAAPCSCKAWWVEPSGERL